MEAILNLLKKLPQEQKNIRLIDILMTCIEDNSQVVKRANNYSGKRQSQLIERQSLINWQMNNINV